jgi:hypothetical protein
MTTESLTPSQRLDRTRADLETLRRRTNTATTLTTLVGILLLAVLCGYFYFGYRLFNEFTQPTTMVDLAAGLIDDQIPEARRALEQQVRDQAPAWAETLSEQALAAVPSAREHFESYVSDNIDGVLEKGTDLTEEKFRAFLQANRDTLTADMKELATSPELAEAQLDTLQESLESQIQLDLRSQFRDLFESLVLLNEKLDRLQHASDLSEDEHRELRLLKLARRLNQRGISSNALSLSLPSLGSRSAAD